MTAHFNTTTSATNAATPAVAPLSAALTIEQMQAEIALQQAIIVQQKAAFLGDPAAIWSITAEEPESHLKRYVWCEVLRHNKKVTDERDYWFNSQFLPRVGVLARLPRNDREALIAHFRAKELREVADAMRDGNHYVAGLARKRLERVNKVAEAFMDVDLEWRFGN